MGTREREAPVVGALRCCTTREQVDDVFSRFDVTAFRERYDTLVKAMYSPRVFFSSASPTDEQKQELALEMFLSGDWKVYGLYDKLEQV